MSGAQRASGTDRASTAAVPRPTARSRAVRGRPRALRPLLLSVLALILVSLPGLALPGPAAAGSGARKAAIIVGPASSSTAEYLAEGERIARQAEAVGMDVVRVFTPFATWKRVRAAANGAHLLVYLGHGNGWPSRYAPYQGATKNGFGLNPCEGTCGRTGPTKYYGTDPVRAGIRLAPGAVVLLHRLCYASGNGEGDEVPVFAHDLAIERVSGYAATFLAIGAAAVIAWGWPQRVDLPRALMRSDLTLDEIFRLSASDHPNAYDGFIGSDDYYADSPVTPGARMHLDPHPAHGHLRAITGDLELGAATWRGAPAPPDTTPPTLTVRATGTVDAPGTADAETTVVFSPNADGEGDRVAIERRLSEPAVVEVEVRNRDGRVIRTMRRSEPAGPGRTAWDGRNADGEVVRDGDFTIHLTPRDRAGNTGRTEVVHVRSITVLRRLIASADAIAPRDADGLADSVEVRGVLSEDARVTWVVRRGREIVRTRFRDAQIGAGEIGWTWNGRDDTGRTLPDGAYTLIVAVTTKAGRVRSSVPIRIGSWALTVGDRTPARGARVGILAVSTEPLAEVVEVRVALPGLPPRIVPAIVGADRNVRVRFAIPAAARAGRALVTIVARDTGGGEEVMRIPLTVR
ncbi:MAG: FlgD immunoglobulin-like domain containing protein [Chloroflexota bacterium]